MITAITSLDSRRDQISFRTKAIWASWALLIMCAIFQIIFFNEIINLIAIIIVALVWWLTCSVWLSQAKLENYLISSFMILGFSASQFYFPLIFTTLENKPVTYNLELPEQVFFHSSAALAILYVAHSLYIKLMKWTPNRSESLLQRMGFFTPPSHLQLWLIGIIGMGSGIYVHFTSPEIGREITGDPGGKLLQAIVPFMYAPFFIPLGKLFGNDQKPQKGFVIMIILYTILLLALGIARNSRGLFMFGFTTPAFAYILGLLLGVFRGRIFTLKHIVGGLLIGWMLMGPLSDLGVAMVNVRLSQSNLKDVSPAELFTLTIDALQDKHAIEKRKEEMNESAFEFDFDDRYLDNIFTARFSNIKYNDSGLIHYGKLGMYDPDMQQYSLNHVIAILPDPVIKFFGFDVDKESILLFSFGDMLYVLSGGAGWPAGLRVGHMAGTGMSTFGWWYLLIFGAVLIPIFYLNDKLFRANPRQEHGASSNSGPFKYSFCGVLALTVFFQFFTFESVVNAIEWLTRGWIQMIGLYFIIFHVTRIMERLIVRRKYSHVPLPSHFSRH